MRGSFFLKGRGGGSASDTEPETTTLRHTSSNQSSLTLPCLVVPALSADRIAVHIGGRDARPRAVADLAPDHRVAAERLGLALGALRLQGPRGADAVAGHRFTQPRATATGWRKDGKDTDQSQKVWFHFLPD